MHNFGPDDSISSQEAQQILAAWANQRQAQAVDATAGSVSSLASGLGVSEEEVRQMLEDIRVQKRSQELAAGIVNKQLAHRKRSDVRAAIIAAVALLVLALVAIGGYAMLHRASNETQIITGVTPLPPVPEPDFDPLDSSENSATNLGPDGQITTINEHTFVHHERDNSNLTLSGQAAVDEVTRRIPETKKKIADLQALKNPTAEDENNLKYWQSELTTLQRGLTLLQSGLKTPEPAG